MINFNYEIITNFILITVSNRFEDATEENRLQQIYSQIDSELRSNSQRFFPGINILKSFIIHLIIIHNPKIIYESIIHT